jgi:hypothetical protein
LPEGTRATLTDLFPNVPAFEHAALRTKGRAQFRATPVDATDVPADLLGVRTLFNAFHHLRPPIARGVLADAARKKQPICVFEVVERRFATMAWLFFVPLAALVFIPFAPGLSLSRVVLTYLVPIIPFAIWWDGMCSCLRGYSRAELQALVDSLPVDDGYAFTITQARTFPLRLTALVGMPVQRA